MSPTSGTVSLRSRIKPRVEVRPAGIVGSYVDEAVDLARLAGLEPDPWQIDSLDLLLSFRDDGLWACRQYAEWVPRQNGKSIIKAVRALVGFFLLGEKKILWSAHQYDTAQEGFEFLRGLIENLEESGYVERGLIKVVLSHGEQGFENPETKQKIKFRTRTKGGGRGFTADVNLIDEAWGYTSTQEAALKPTMKARPNGQLVLVSTPPLDGFTAVPMFKLRNRAEPTPGKLATPEEIGRLGYRDWGLGGDLENVEHIDLDDRSVWRRTNPAWGIRIDEHALDDDRKSMTPQDFAREDLGVWPRAMISGGAIDLGKWEDMLDAESARHGDVACAVDISPLRDYASITMYGLREDGAGHGQVLRYHPGTNWIVSAMVEIQEKKGPIAWGMGGGTFKSLRDELIKVGIKVPDDLEYPPRGAICVVSGSDMAAACGQMLDAVKQKSFFHVGDVPLEGAVRGAKLRQTGDVIAWARRESDTDISPLVALTLARWAYLTRVELVNADRASVYESRGLIVL